jgi:hypothetical protein
MKTKKYRKPKHHKVTRKSYRRKNKKTIRRKNRVRKNKTRKLNAGGLLDAITKRIARRRENKEPIPLGEDSFETVDPAKDADALGREKYQGTMDKEYVVGEFGQTLRDEDSKMGQARKDAQSAVTQSYGADTWRQLHHHFPGKPIPIPEETVQGLSTIFPPVFWENIMSKMKFSVPLEKDLFMDTLFANKKTYELKGAFLKPGVTTSDIRDKVNKTLQTPQFLLPYMRKRFSEDQLGKIENRVVKKIEGFVNLYHSSLKTNLTRFAVNYWENPSLGDKNYIRTKNHIIEKFGERNWQMISGDVKSTISSILNTTEQ